MRNKNNTEPMEISDFVGKGRDLNFKGLEMPKDINSAIEKGVISDAIGGYSNTNTFTKTGKEVAEKIKILKAAVETKKATALSDMKKITENLDKQPSRELDEWEKRDLPDGVADTIKKYPWECCYFNSNSRTNDTIAYEGEKSSHCASSEEEAKQCSAYNNIVSSYLDACRDLQKADVFLRNVDEKSTYKLTLNEINSLGF